MLASFKKTGPLVPRVKETNRHPVEVEKASASLVGIAGLRSSAAERLVLTQGCVGASPTGGTKHVWV